MQSVTFSFFPHPVPCASFLCSLRPGRHEAPALSPHLLSYLISCSLTISLMITTRTKERKPRSHETGEMETWLKVNEELRFSQSFRSSTVCATCPSNLSSETDTANLSRARAGICRSGFRPSCNSPGFTTKAYHQFSSGEQLPHTTIFLSTSRLVLEQVWSSPSSSTFWRASSGPGDTHTTATVSVHHRLERGLFFHSGLVRWTWVMDMNTVGTGRRGII